jgi:GTP-binding protein
VPPPQTETAAPLQFQISTLAYNSYVGRIGIGRIRRGSVRPGQVVNLRFGDADKGTAKIGQVLTYKGLERVPVDEAYAGDIVAITGVEEVNIGLTICDPEGAQGLPPISVDEPTIQMNFQVNNSPLAGREGKFVTSRQIRERLYRELQSNVALRVEDTDEPDIMRVSGRGELHLTILIENMRREGYELSISKPHVITKKMDDGSIFEPIEYLVVDVPEKNLGGVMELVGNRRGELVRMDNRLGQVHLEFTIPARGLIGLRTRMLTATQGEAVMHHNFHEYAPLRGEVPSRANGVMISNVGGSVNAFALNTLQERGVLFVDPSEPVYQGQVVGEHCHEDDIVVNPTKAKKLSNMRTTSSDENIILKPSRKMTLEQALEYIEDDELVEATPTSIRLRKDLLTENERKRAGRKRATEMVEA